VVWPGFDGALVRCSFDGKAWQPADARTPGLALQAGLVRASQQRHAEYYAGRYCALTAMQDLGVAAQAIPTGRNRAPQWPPGLVGSITHHRSVACCAVARTAVCSAVGIDLERCMDAVQVASHADLIADHEELALLRRQESAFEWLLTLLFSAKESLFKALYPAIQYYFDFLDVQIVELKLGQGHLTLALKRDLALHFPAGRRFRVQFRPCGQDILTLLWCRYDDLPLIDA
jgi:enterobactin synthetase component D